MEETAELEKEEAAQSSKARKAGHISVLRLKRFVRLERLQNDMELKLKDIKIELAQVEKQLMEDFVATGIQKIEVAGRVVFLHRMVFAILKKGVTREAVCNALKSAGYGDFVAENFNSNQLSSLLRESEKQGNLESLLTILENTVKLMERFSVRSVKAI